MTLETCLYCGCRKVFAHEKYTDRCEECGKRYNRYISAKSRKNTKALETVTAEYSLLRNLGCKVPKALREVQK
jgi:hypothetical protein